MATRGPVRASFLALVLGCTVRSVRAVNVVHATQKLHKTTEADAIMIAIHRSMGIQLRSANLWRHLGATAIKILRRWRRKLPCKYSNRKGSVSAWGGG